MLMIKWSFSSLKDFCNCPKQYQEIKILKNFTKRATQQMLYGTEVHKALEDYVTGIPLAKNYERFKNVMDALLEIPGTRYPEYKMAITEDKKYCDFDSKDYWARGIADLIVVDESLAYVIDYKTGSNRYPDADQLKLMALFIFVHFPEVNTVKGGLLFVMHNSFLTVDFKREYINDYWKSFEAKLARLTAAADNEIWSPNPTPLCGWCPVKTCEFHKG